MKAQVATEYMIIVSFALLVLVPFALYLQNVSQNFSDDSNLNVASNSVKEIGQTADWVYSQGEPAKLKILVQVPNNVESITINGKELNWRVRTSSGLSDIYYTSVTNLMGSLPNSPGYYYITVQAMSDGVNLSVSTG